MNSYTSRKKFENSKVHQSINRQWRVTDQSILYLFYGFFANIYSMMLGRIFDEWHRTQLNVQREGAADSQFHLPTSRRRRSLRSNAKRTIGILMVEPILRISRAMGEVPSHSAASWMALTESRAMTIRCFHLEIGAFPWEGCN